MKTCTHGDCEKQNSFMKKIHFESPILALCDKAANLLGKASRDTYNQGG